MLIKQLSTIYFKYQGGGNIYIILNDEIRLKDLDLI